MSSQKDHGFVTRDWLASLGPIEQDYDYRITPQLIDRAAQKHPDRVWASFAETQNPSDGFRSVTWREVSQAINRMVIWLEGRIGDNARGEILGFLANSKLSSLVLTVAASKLGCAVLFMSPRNSLQGQLSLLDKLGCNYLATPEIQLPQVEELLRERPAMRHLVLPELDFFLSGPNPPPRPFLGTMKELHHKAFFYVHSSGTTSLPKPVSWTYGTTASMLHELLFNYPEGKSLVQASVGASPRMMIGFPLFHGAGIIWPLCISPVTGMEAVFPPEGIPMNSSLASQMCQSSKAPFTAFLPPTIIEGMMKDPDHSTHLLRQTAISTGGAALSREIGNTILRKGTKLINIVAASETGFIPLVEPKPESEWFAFHFPKAPGVRMDLVKDGRYELVLYKVDDTERCPPVFNNYPHLNEYRTNDLFERHPNPSLSHMWVIAGRSDDVIVLSNGEKFTPLALEDRLQGHPEVLTALVFGMQREQAALLIEPEDKSVYQSKQSQDKFLDRIWPEVEQANLLIAQHGRILRSHIFLATAMKGVLRTPKLSVMRSKMYELYDLEIEELYARAADSRTDHADCTLNGHENGDDQALKILRAKICGISNISEQKLGMNSNFFLSGFDSLHCIQLATQLRTLKGQKVPTSLIYNNPTVRKLQTALEGTTADTIQNTSESSYLRSTDVSTTVEELSKDLPQISPKTKFNRIALMTGTSGGLGQHMLNAARSRFSHVYCLLRQPVPSEKQKLVGVTYLYADLAAPYLGLARSEWLLLLESVTHVIHNAWLVDFNQPLTHFGAILRGLRNLIDFAIVARHRPRIWFASSIGAVAGLGSSLSSSGDTIPLPEKIYPISNNSLGKESKEGDDGRAPADKLGYAQSKRAAELLLARAGEICGVKSTICRIGQIAGTSQPGLKDMDGQLLPSWPTRDLIPTMLRSSKYLNAIPSDIDSLIGRLDWIPVDHLATAAFELLDAGDSEDAETTMVFHLTNPAEPPPSWTDLLPTIKRRLELAGENTKADSTIEVTTLQEWTSRLEQSASKVSTATDLEKNPAVKLLDFFRGAALAGGGIPVLDTTKARGASKVLREMEAVNERLMGEWIESWMGEWFGVE